MVKKNQFYSFYYVNQKKKQCLTNRKKKNQFLLRNMSKKKKLKIFDNFLFNAAQKGFFLSKILIFKFFQSRLLVPFISHFVNYFFFYFIFLYFFYDEIDMLRVWKNWEIYIACFNFFLEFLSSIFF